MKQLDAAGLLERIEVLQSRCDLDLLVFFVRHPTSLLTSEQLAAWLGHELKAIATSLDVLLEAGLIERTQNFANATRMYVFRRDAPGRDWLGSLLGLANTRTGRLALIDALASRSERGRTRSSTQTRDDSGASRSPALSIVRIPGHGGSPTPDRRKTRRGGA